VYLVASWVGLGELAKAAEAVRRLAPSYLASRLNGDVNFRNPEHKSRIVRFLRIAAGQKDPAIAAALL
jgi:hypothetical protein